MVMVRLNAPKRKCVTILSGPRDKGATKRTVRAFEDYEEMQDFADAKMEAVVAAGYRQVD